MYIYEYDQGVQRGHEKKYRNRGRIEAGERFHVLSFDHVVFNNDNTIADPMRL